MLLGLAVILSNERDSLEAELAESRNAMQLWKTRSPGSRAFCKASKHQITKRKKQLKVAAMQVSMEKLNQKLSKSRVRAK